MLAVTLLSQNVENGEDYALFFALVVTLILLTAWLIYVWVGIYKGNEDN